MDAPNNPALAELTAVADDLMSRFDAMLADANQEPATVQALGELADDLTKRFEEAFSAHVMRGVAHVFSGQQCSLCGWHLRTKNNGICPVCPAEEGAR